jgi:hypothetical protein
MAVYWLQAVMIYDDTYFLYDFDDDNFAADAVMFPEGGAAEKRT